MSGMVANYTRSRRKVFFDAKNAVSIVRSARRYGNEATTFQAVERTVDYSLTVVPFDKILTQRSFVEDGLKYVGNWERTSCQMTSEEIKTKLELLPGEIRDYLKGKCNGLLPAGYGWDGKHTNVELARAARIKQLIIGDADFKNITTEVIDIITEDAFITPSGHLTMDWDKSIEFLDRIWPQLRNPDSKLFVFAQNKDISVRLDLNDETELASITIDPIYDRVVVIVTKFIVTEGYPNHGISLELYKRKST